MQRLNIEDVRKAFDDRGDKLLSTVYVNNQIKLDYICKKDHQCSIKWSNYKQNKGCAKCAGCKKLTIDEVRDEFENRGDKLLSTVYEGKNAKLEYICKNGHQISIAWTSYQQGRGCLICSGSAKPTLTELRAVFESRGDKLLSTIYKNRKTKLDYVCKNGHKQSSTWDCYQREYKCLICSGYARINIADLRVLFKSRGDRLLSTTYKSGEKLDYVCSNGHSHSMLWCNYSRGQGCPECDGQTKPTILEVSSRFLDRGDKLLSTVYVNSHLKLDYVCKNGHNHSIAWGHYRHGKGCPICAEYGFNPLIPAIFYYIRFEHNQNFYYKIGITNNTVKIRFRSAKIKPIIIYEKSYDIGQDALDREHELLDHFSCFRLSKKHFKESFDFLGNASGHTELFDFDVLNLDR